MTWNVANLTRSNRETELERLLEEKEPHIVVLTETELRVFDTTFTVKNYSVLYPNPAGEKYRLLLLIRSDLAFTTAPSVLHKSALDIWVRLNLPSGSLAVGGVYRQWGGSSTTTNEKEDITIIHGHAADVAGSFRRAALLGDFNLDMAKDCSTYYRHSMLEDHVDRLEDLGFLFVGPSSPTYHSHGCYSSLGGPINRRTSILDHVYVMLGDTSDLEVSVIPYAATDHFPVVVTFPVCPPGKGFTYSCRRNFGSICSSDLLFALDANSLSEVFNSEDVNNIHETILRVIVAALDVVAPMREVAIKNRQTPLNLKADTLRTMELRDSAAVAGNMSEYRKHRNKAVRLLRRDKLDSNQDMLGQGFDPKRVWSLANAVMGKGSGHALPTELDGIEGDDKLADHMNKFYVDKISKLRDRITAPPVPNSPTRGENREEVGEFILKEPSVASVTKEIMALKNTGAKGVDKIPVLVLKKGVEVLAAPITHLISTSIRTGMVPDGFKLANVHPVYKKKKPVSSASSYRPVSILPALSKVMERVVHKQLMEHMEHYLPNSQHGFRPRRNTTGAIIAAHGSWMKARAANNVVGIAAFDLSAAFDTLDHDKLANKMRGLGVVGKSAKWFQGYLGGRSQRVLYNSSTSSFRDVRYGVPQGSILGPLLFLCLLVDLPGTIVDLVKAFTASGSSGYADDCIAWATGPDPAVVRSMLETMSGAVCRFMNDNYLVLNNEKTQILLVGTSEQSPIQVGGATVSPSDRVDVLGVSFDGSLSTRPHMRSSLASARSIAAATRRLSLHLRREALQQVARALIVGKDGYGAAALKPRLSSSDPQNGDLLAMQVAVNDCARHIVGSSRGDKMPVKRLLLETGLPSLNRLIVEQIAMEAWKGMNYTGPNGVKIPIGDILCSTDSTRRHTRAAASSSIPPPTKFKCETFAWYAYKIWNDCPALRSAPNLSNASKAAKEYAALTPL